MPTRHDRGEVSDEDAPVGLPWHSAEGVPSSELAQASVALGAVFSLGAVPTLQIIHTLWVGNFRGFDHPGLLAAAIGGGFAGLFIFVCVACGFVFGLRGMAAARRHGRTAALPMAGALLNFLAFWLWVGVAVCWAIAVGANL